MRFIFVILVILILLGVACVIFAISQARKQGDEIKRLDFYDYCAGRHFDSQQIRGAKFILISIC